MENELNQSQEILTNQIQNYLSSLPPKSYEQKQNNEYGQYWIIYKENNKELLYISKGKINKKQIPYPKLKSTAQIAIFLANPINLTRQTKQIIELRNKIKQAIKSIKNTPIFRPDLKIRKTKELITAISNTIINIFKQNIHHFPKQTIKDIETIFYTIIPELPAKFETIILIPSGLLDISRILKFSDDLGILDELSTQLDNTIQSFSQQNINKQKQLEKEQLQKKREQLESEIEETNKEIEKLKLFTIALLKKEKLPINMRLKIKKKGLELCDKRDKMIEELNKNG